METDSKKKVWRVLGYGAMAFVAFFFFLYKTFPFELIVHRATNPIQRQARMRVKIDRLKPYWLSGGEATGLNIRKTVKKGTAEVQIEHLTARLSLLPLLTGALEVNFSASLARGNIKGTVRRKSKVNSLKLQLDTINLAALGPPGAAYRQDKQAKPLLAMLFAPVYGRLTGDVDITIPEFGAPKSSRPKPKPRAKPKRRTRKRRRSRRRTNRRRSRTRKRKRRKYQRRGIDINGVQGNISITIRNFSVGPGYFPAGQMGELPVPLIQLGTLQLKLKIANSQVEIVKATAIGDDAEIYLTGKVRLRSRLAYSVFSGKVRFKIKPSFTKRRSTPALLRGALGMLGPAKGGFHTFKIYAPFRGRPRFTKQ